MSACNSPCLVMQVMVLFCDVVGFTAMSKEMEPSQVRG
jgi:class 3 adenylate cyclase